MSQPAEDRPVSSSAPKLNILALPSYTAILFALIALVVLGATFTSLLPGSQLWWAPTVLGLVLLSLRDYLRRPRLWMYRQRLAPSRADAGAAPEDSAHHLEVQSIQNELADLAGEHPSPLVTVSPQQLAIHAFGTGRQCYVGIGQEAASQLAKSLQNNAEHKRRPARAILAHELAHFLNRDISMMGLSYSLLKMMILVMLVNLWMAFSFSLFLIQVGPEVLQPAFWDGMTNFLAGMLPGLPLPDLSSVLLSLEQRNPSTFARLADPNQGIAVWTPFFLFQVSTYLPFIVSGIVLFGLYWRRLLRVRELYADARAASLMSSGGAVIAGLVHAARSSLTDKPPAEQRAEHSWRRWLPTSLGAVQPHFALHPSFKERRACLAEPQRVFGSWRAIAVSAGLAVAMLELVLRSPLTAGLISQPGAHLAFATGFVVFGLWLLPQWCLGSQRDAHLGRALVGMVLLYTAIKVAPYLLDLLAALLVQATNPGGWGRSIDLWVYGMLGIMGDNLPRIVGVEISWSQFILWHILAPIAYFTLVMPPALLGFLWLDSALKRRALTWYRLGNRVRRVWFAITAVLLGVLLLLVVPVSSRIFFPWVYETVSLLAIAGVAAGFILALVGGVAFLLGNGRWAERCSCGASLAGDFDLGRICPDCGAGHHQWLIASY